MDGWPMSLCTPWRHVRKKKLPISVPVRRSDLTMAKSRPPHSGDSCLAARLALAFDLKPRSSLHAFHTSKPCVTCMSIPLVLTLTSPAVVDLDVRAVVMSALLNISSPTGFLAPLLPSQLWNAIHAYADIAVALTTCWFSDKYFAASSRSTLVTWSSLLQPTTDVVHGHLDLCQRLRDHGR
jgi:hypothetical protein